MPRPNFHDELFLKSQGPFKAGGPVAPTQTLDWVWAWIYQNRNAAAAAAGGDTGPFTGNWDVPLQMAPGSPDFTPDWPAQATAIALVDEEGQKEAYWWSEAVLLRP